MHSVEFEVPSPYLRAGASSVFTVDRELKGRLDRMVRERAADAIPASWVVKTGILEGRPHLTVPGYAAEVEADLMVLAGESHIDLGERVMGGTVERMARRAPCPMLVV